MHLLLSLLTVVSALALYPVAASAAKAATIDSSTIMCPINGDEIDFEWDEMIRKQKLYGLLLQDKRPQRDVSADDGREIKLDTYVHVVARPEDAKGQKTGFIASNTTINEQISIMNRALVKAKISLHLQDINWVVHKHPLKEPMLNVAEPHDITHRQDIRDLVRGNSSAVNLFILNTTDPILAGRSWPLIDLENTRGVFIAADGLRMGKNPHWHDGLQGVHELGHWLGISRHFADNHLCFFDVKGCSSDASCRNLMTSSRDQCKDQEFSDEQAKFFRYSVRNIIAGNIPLSSAMYEEKLEAGKDPQKGLPKASRADFAPISLMTTTCDFPENKRWDITSEACRELHVTCYHEQKDFLRLKVFKECFKRQLKAKGLAELEVGTLGFPETFLPAGVKENPTNPSTLDNSDNGLDAMRPQNDNASATHQPQSNVDKVSPIRPKRHSKLYN